MREVRLIGASGEQVGIVPTYKAMDAAKEQGLDLVEVSPDARPPVCKILDYGKYKYEHEKREKEARKKQHIVVVKEIKKVSRSEREWAGALAGRAWILVEATVSDLNSGKLIETFAAEGESSGGSNLAGTTEEAIQRAAEQVVAQVIKISRQTRQ